MKFSCLQENLSQGLSKNTHLAGTSRTSLPILNNILLTAEKNSLILSATNLEIAIKTKVRAKIEKQGQVTIPSQLLNNYINLLPNEVLNFETNKEELIIKSKKQEAKIKGISSEEFPIIPEIERIEKYIIKGKELKSGLESVVFAISSSEVRNELSGALFSFNSPDKNKLTLVGTDSYRLTENQIDIEKTDSKNKKEIIVPLRTVQEVLKLIKEQKNVEIYLSENQILFIYEETELVSRIINGEYPDYKQTIPQAIKTSTLINKEEFLRSVKAAGFFSKIGINDISLKFLPKKSQLIISSLNNQVGENKTTLSAEISGEENQIVFNYRYLLDGLVNLPDNEVKIELINDETPGLLKPDSNKPFLYLIMPIKNN